MQKSRLASRPLSHADFHGKPQVMLLGQYSTGKTSFIEYLLGTKFPGMRVGPEPTTDRFVAVIHGEEDRVIPGNALVVSPEVPYRGLDRFGAGIGEKDCVGKGLVDQTLRQRLATLARTIKEPRLPQSGAPKRTRQVTIRVPYSELLPFGDIADESHFHGARRLPRGSRVCAIRITRMVEQSNRREETKPLEL